MEKTLFNNVAIGSVVTSPYMVLDVKEKVAKNGKTFLDIELCDGENRQFAKKWDATAVSLGLVTGNVAIFTVKCEDYQGKKSFTITEIAPAHEGDYELSDFIRKAPFKETALYNKIFATANAFENQTYKTLVTSILEENKDKLLFFAAGKKAHHDYYAGLLYHVYRMLATGNNIAKTYPVLNRELLLSGIILHDIGKLEELDCDKMGTVSDYTTDGKMFGHSYLGARYVHDWAKEHLSADAENDIRLLEHLIVAHSGTAEYGAITKPALPEAWALHLVDLLDARLNQVEDVLNTLEGGNWSEPAYFLESARIYKVPVVKEDPAEKEEKSA